jgi:hypothetical protein
VLVCDGRRPAVERTRAASPGVRFAASNASIIPGIIALRVAASITWDPLVGIDSAALADFVEPGMGLAAAFGACRPPIFVTQREATRVSRWR